MTQETSPEKLRRKIRLGDWQAPTSGLVPGFIQTNLAILPKEMAFEFLLFCQRNPKACPVIDVTEPGSFIPALSAPNADLRTDIPKYRVYKDGVLMDELTDIQHLWTDDMVAFLLGCSFTFEEALVQNGITMRHQQQGCNVPMYKTSIPTVPAGRFQGPTVVSMRPIREQDIVRAVQVTSRFPNVHGAPIHIGNPESIGIQNIDMPDFGDAVEIKPGEVPVFWACGVTPQAVAMESKPALMITHAPGHMFVTDLKSEDFSVF